MYAIRSYYALVLGGLPRALRSLLGGYALLMGWAWLSLEVRQFWHGTLLNAHQVFSAEQYAYSAVRITSYNVCYTKLLRLSHAQPISRA